MDFIIVLENGSISEYGTYRELLEKNGHFAEFISIHLNDEVIKFKEDSGENLMKRKKEEKKQSNKIANILLNLISRLDADTGGLDRMYKQDDKKNESTNVKRYVSMSAEYTVC